MKKSKERAIAERIADYLFTDGETIAERLVLQMSDNKEGSSWVRQSVVDYVEKTLKESYP